MLHEAFVGFEVRITETAGIRCRVVWQEFTDVSEERIASIKW
jgi:hypothetical protein